MAAQIPVYSGTLPATGQQPTAFDTNVTNWLNYVQTYVAAANTVATEVETNRATAQTAATTATTQATNAATSATSAATSLTAVQNLQSTITTNATNAATTAAVAASATNSAAAQAAADAAAATANFEGAYSGLTGALSIPASVTHTVGGVEKIWMLLQNLTDVTTQVPGAAPAYWKDITPIVNPMTAANDVIIGGANGIPTRLAAPDSTNRRLQLIIENGVMSWEEDVPNFRDSFSPTPANVEDYSGEVVPHQSPNRWPGLDGQSSIIQSTSFAIYTPAAAVAVSVTASSRFPDGTSDRWVSSIPSNIDNVYYLLGRSSTHTGLFSINKDTFAITQLGYGTHASFGYPHTIDSVPNRRTFLMQKPDGNLFIEHYDSTGATASRWQINKTNGQFVSNDASYVNPANGKTLFNGINAIQMRPTSDGELAMTIGHIVITGSTNIIMATADIDENFSVAPTDPTIASDGVVSGYNGWPTQSIAQNVVSPPNNTGDSGIFMPWYPGTYLAVGYDISSTSLKNALAADRHWIITETEFDRWVKSLGNHAGLT